MFLPPAADWVATQAYHSTLSALAAIYKAGLGLYNAIRARFKGLKRAFYSLLYNIAKTIHAQAYLLNQQPDFWAPNPQQLPLAGSSLEEGIEKGRYRYTIRSESDNPDAIDTTPTYITMFSDTNLTLGEAKQAAYAVVAEKIKAYPVYDRNGVLQSIDDIKVQVTRIWRQY